MKDDNKIIIEAASDLSNLPLDKYWSVFYNFDISDLNLTVDEQNAKLRFFGIVRKLIKDPSLIILPDLVRHLRDVYNTEKKTIDELSNNIDSIKKIDESKKILDMAEKLHYLTIESRVEKYLKSALNDVMSNICNSNKHDKNTTSFKIDIGGEDGEYVYETYLINACKYQYEFYLRSSKIDQNTLSLYKELRDNAEFMAAYCKSLSEQIVIPFTFNYNMLNPFELSLKEIDEFRENVVMYMKLMTVLTKKSDGAAIFVDFPKDKKGRITNRNKLEDLYVKWQRYLDAYDYNKKGVPSEEIYNKLHSDRHVSDPNKSIKSYLKYADRYIQSTEKGTFPHIE